MYDINELLFKHGIIKNWGHVGKVSTKSFIEEKCFVTSSEDSGIYSFSKSPISLVSLLFYLIFPHISLAFSISYLIIFSIFLYVLFSPYIFLYLLLKLHFALSHFLPCHSSNDFTISLLNDITVSLYFFFYFSLSLSHSFYLSQCGHFFTHTILCKCNNIDIGRLQTLFVYQN